MATQTSQPKSVRGRGWRRLFLIVLVVLIVVGLYPLGRYIWASNHYRSAINAINRRDFEEARRHLEICCRELPDSAETYFLAARTARRAGDLKAARDLLKEALAKGWVKDQIELEQALANLQQQAISGIQQTEYGRLRTMLINKVREGHPDAVLILEVLAPIADQIADIQLADECVHRWIELDPNDPRPHVVMGNVWTRLQNKAGASKEFREAIQLDPNNAEARMKLGKSLMIEKLFDQAREQFEWLKQRNPDDPEMRLQLAQVEHATGNDEAARQILKGLITDRPDEPESLGLMGQIELEANEPEKAEETLRKAYKIAPNDLHIMYQLFLTLSRLDKSKEAAEIQAKWDKGKKDDEQIAILLRELNKEAHNPEVRRQIGLRLISRGFIERGYTWLLNSMNDDQTYVPTHQSLVDYYEQHGNRQKAEEHRQIIKMLQQQKAEQTIPPKQKP